MTYQQIEKAAPTTLNILFKIAVIDETGKPLC